MNDKRTTDRPRARSGSAILSDLDLNTMLPAPFRRLRKRREFLEVQKSGIKFVTPGFVLQVGHAVSKQEGGSLPRIGYTVSRKVGGAVERNRVKRKLRELGRLVLSSGAPDDRSYVLIGRRAAINRPTGRMADDLKRVLRQVEGSSET